jgi:hypothetical protein
MEKKITESRTAMLEATNYWDELLALRDKQREQRKDGVQVVRLDELPLESNRQGLMRWYTHPSITDTVLSTFMFFRQEIPPKSRSGRLKFQGGQVMYIVAGKGYTLIDGVKYPWEAGDTLNLPLRKDGIVIQHFNEHPDETAAFIAAEPNWFACTTVDRGSGFEQIEDSPDYKKK